MGMDLYAGTLTRYYAHNWKTISQQWAEEHGYGFQRVSSTGDALGEETVSPEEVQRGMETWRDWLLKALSRPGQVPFAVWEEDNERPYFTDKPDWDAFGALLLVAACHIYGGPVPEMVAKGWDFWDHPLIRRMGEDRSRGWSLFRGVEWWLPLSETILFEAPRPGGDKGAMASVSLLRWELEQIDQLVWQAEEETVLDWSHTEGYPTDGWIDGVGQVTMGETHRVYRTESLARFAYSVFYRAVKFAEENRVPILMDY